jgi:hypothetical protein
MKKQLLMLAFLFSGLILTAQPTLNLNVFLEGLCVGNGLMRNTLYTCNLTGNVYSADYIDVDLINPSTCCIVQTGTVILSVTGTAQMVLASSTQGNSYYIRVRNRNHIEVWSASPVTIMQNTIYDFTSAASKAYGNNETAACSYYAMFAGDVNSDCQIDGLDFLVIDPLIQNGGGGYIVEDVNGDCAVDGDDFLIMDPNIQNGAGCAQPCSPVCRLKSPPIVQVQNTLQWNVMPNPATDNLTVQTNFEKCELKIFNSIGEIVRTEKVNYQTTVEISQLPKGIYYVTIEREGRVEGSKRVAVQ